MSTLQLATIKVLNDDVAKTPVPDVVVRIYENGGTQFVTQGTTDELGEVQFNLVAPSSLQARFYRTKLSIKPVWAFEVSESDENYFEVTGHLFKPPEAVHPRLCRASGFFLYPNGAPAPNHDIHFIAKFRPLLFEGDAMLKERVHGRTDEHGYFQIDLVRCGQYDVTVEGFEDQLRCITIPEYPSVNLPDLLFPVVERIEFDPPGPWAVGVGIDVELPLTPTIWDSTGRQLDGTAVEDVIWKTADPSVAVVLVAAKQIFVRGLSPGTTTLIAERADRSIVRIPNTPIHGVPVAISVG